MSKMNLVSLVIKSQELDNQRKIIDLLEANNPSKKPSKHISTDQFWKNSRRYHLEKRLWAFFMFCCLVYWMTLCDWS